MAKKAKHIISMLVILTFYILTTLFHEQYPQVISLAMVFTWTVCFLCYYSSFCDWVIKGGNYE